MREANSEWQSLQRDALQRWQAQRLRRYLETTVLPFSKFYATQHLDVARLRTLDDLRRLPFTTKRDVQERVRDFILTPDEKILARRVSTIFRVLTHGRAAVADEFEREFRPLLLTFTTGRSSEPVAFVHTARDIRNLQTAGRRIIEVAGGKHDWKMINMFPFAPHLAFWQTHYAGTEFGAFMVGSGGGKVLGTEGNLRLIQKLQPEVLIAMPTFLYHVLQQALAHGVTNPYLRTLVLGGEKAPLGMRRKLRRLAAELGAPKINIVLTYGFTEAKLAWTECPHAETADSGGYHIFPDLAVIEIIDPKTLEPVAPGNPGEIVFTPLDARGTVALRYRTGDIIDGGLVFGPCPHCGRNVPRLVGRISRTSEIKEMQLDKLKGTLVDFNQLEHVLDNVDSIGTWQIELRKANDDPLDVDELILHVQRRNGTDEEKIRDELNERVASLLEVHPNRITFHTADEMRRLQGVGTQIKEQRVIDHRPPAAATTGVTA